MPSLSDEARRDRMVERRGLSPYLLSMPTTELSTDVALGVAIPSRNARGRLARLGSVVDDVLAKHDYPPVIERLLAEALVLTALLGSLLKEPEGQITMQAQTEAGVIDLMVCDYRSGELRGYIRYDPQRLAEAGPTPSLFALFGKGYLAITFDHPGMKERYQGIVPLEGGSLGEAAQSFFAQSEQIPSIVRLAAQKRDGHWSAGGLLFQHLPEGEEGRERLHTRLDHPDWPHVAILAGSVKAEELTDTGLPLDDLLWRLFHEEDEVRTLDAIALRKGCRCDPDYVRSVIAKFPAEERADMVGEDGLIRVDCEFCSTSFPLALEEFD
ncbi:Hsp33 family molecular chaperone [Sphingomonas lutea]